MANSAMPSSTDDDPLHLSDDRSNLVYTSCYCEENVWKLCEEIARRTRPLDSDSDVISHCHVAFISNPNKTVPIWCQRASHDPASHPVVWDYHVILIFDSRAKSPDGRGRTKSASLSTTSSSSSLVYDLDTVLSFPQKFSVYYEKSFHNDSELKPAYRRFFRVIPADEYLRRFASDRRHMRRTDGSWKMPPPSYPPIVAADGDINNIDKCIDVTQKASLGRVVDANEFYKMFADG